MLTYCVPLIPTAVFWWIMGVSDRYLVKWFVESDANGIYAVAYKIPTILTILATVFMDAWQLSAIAESGDRRAQARFYARVWDAFFSAVCLCAGGIIAFSPLLIRLLAAESYYDAWRYIPILTLSMIAAAFSNFMGSVYVVTKKSTASLWISLAAAAANIALDLFLIPRIGVQSAARGGRRTAVYKKYRRQGLLLLGGLAVGVLQIKTTPTNQQTDKVDITTTSAIRLLLDRAATVEEAVELLSQYDMHASAGSCYHFHIADAKGGSVIVEYIDDEMSVVQGDAATNFLLTPGEYDFGSGEDRYAVLRETLDANGGVFESEEQAMELLKAVSQPASEEKKSSTQWSCVYNQQDAGVEIAMNMDYEKVYTFGL